MNKLLDGMNELFESDRSLEYSDEELNAVTTTEVIKTTFKIYGTIFGISFVVFLVLRNLFPVVYAFNSTPYGRQTALAKDRHGCFGWMWKVFHIEEDEIFECCGFSALVYIRFLKLGLKLAGWGVFNSIFLIPINIFGCDDEGDPCYSFEDAVDRASLGNVSMGNPSLIATTVAAYIVFGKAMQYIFKEFRWFTKYSHKFSIQPRPDNYTVYVAHIPVEYRRDMALLEYFRSIFSHDDVLEATVALDIFGLDLDVAKRETVVKNLEHSINIRKIGGHEVGGYERKLEGELDDLNDKISSVIDQIKDAKEKDREEFLRQMLLANGITCKSLDVVNESSARKLKLGRQYSSRHLIVDDLPDDDEKSPADASWSVWSRLKRRPPPNTPPDSIHEVQNESMSDEEGDVEEVPIDNIHDENNALVNDMEETSSPVAMVHLSPDRGQRHNRHPTFSTVESLGSKHPEDALDLPQHDDINVERSPLVYDLSQVGFPYMTTPNQSARKQHKRVATMSSVGSAASKASKQLKKAAMAGIMVGKLAGKTIEQAGKYTTDVGKTLAGTVNGSAVLVSRVAGKKVKDSVINVKDLAVFSAKLATSASSSLTRLLFNVDNTEVRESGFVTFTNLTAKTQCAQIIHHHEPYNFLVEPAPLPKDIIWDNVGKTHHEIQVGALLATAATAALCLVWTIPVAFFTSLSETESLKNVLPGLEKVIEENPWVAFFLAQLSPLLLVLLTELLPSIISVICKYEGHIGKNTWNASKLTKLSVFMVIQIFFVQAISGSVFDELKAMLKDQSLIVDLLAKSIPTQVKSFIQFILVQTFLGCAIELLRVARVVMALIRKRVGPNLTEEERNEPYLFLKPITAPDDMDFTVRYAEMILCLMVNLVYSCVAPIMSYFVLLTFGVLSLVYRHQLIYLYNKDNDSGGKLWSRVIALFIVCMFTSEVTLIGILSLKKGSIAAALLFPLLAITVLFLIYCYREHMRVTQFVPSTLCKETDIQNHDTLDLSFLREQYLQPSLKNKLAYPKNGNKNGERLGECNAIGEKRSESTLLFTINSEESGGEANDCLVDCGLGSRESSINFFGNGNC